MRRARRVARTAGFAVTPHLLRRGGPGWARQYVSPERRKIAAPAHGGGRDWPTSNMLGRRWPAVAWRDSGVGRGAPQGRRSHGLRSVASGCRGIRRDRVVVSRA